MDDTTNDLVAQIIDGFEPGAFVTKYVVIAEVISPDGERGIWSQTSDDATRWDSYGLLMECLTAEQASQTAMALRDDEE